jgi:RimJ/RimL family protein N-acetyltransferase
MSLVTEPLNDGGRSSQPLAAAESAASQRVVDLDLCGQWTSCADTNDHQQIVIRPLRPDDRGREVAFIESLSERTRYLRLLEPLKVLPPDLLTLFMDIDYRETMALVAVVSEAFVGVVRYGATDRPDTVEMAIAVTDSWQRRGIARILLCELMRYARWRGFGQMTGIVLPENCAMLGLARSVGFRISIIPDDHLMRIDRDLTTLNLPLIRETRAGNGEVAADTCAKPA